MTALLRSGPRPVRGFLLHSYGGPAERIPELADMGAYFGFPGYFLGPRKAERSAVFRDVPPGRLLVETDAPDQLLPPELRRHGLKAADGAELNHPAELAGVYAGLAEVRGECVETLAARVEENFKSLFRHGWEPGMPGPD
jgi:TatD DNase family protein